jgi:AcrR family transcriptional regulator
MPKGFTDKEKVLINEQLMEQARKFLVSHGMRKTSVEDLTRGAGISKGAFYLFYGSKEELFFEVLEKLDHQIRHDIFDGDFVLPGMSAKESFKQKIRNGLRFIEENPALGKFDSEDFMYLVRKLPEEKLARHMRQDDEDLSQFVETWQSQGYIKGQPILPIVTLLKSIFMLALQRQELGAGYPEMVELLLDMMAEYLVTEE